MIPDGNHVIDFNFFVGGANRYPCGFVFHTDVAISFIMLELASHKPRMPSFHHVGACISQAKNALVS